MNSNSLDYYRQKIDAIDDQIVHLLGERFKVVSELGQIKKKMALNAYDPSREQKIIERILIYGEKLKLNPILLQAIFLQIFAVSKQNQV